MKLGRLPRRLGAAVVAALASVPLAASSAAAAPAAPPAYTVVVRAYPFQWTTGGGLPVVDLKVPWVEGVTNNIPLTSSKAALADPDLQVKPMSGDQIQGLTCSGFDEAACREPFQPEAAVSHNSADPAHTERAAAFEGKDGKYPGSIRAYTDCPGDCGNQLVRTLGEAAGPAGGLSGYISIGSSSASHDVTIDDRGQLVGVSRSELRNVVIGPNGEVRASSILTTAHAFGSGAVNTKDGRADVRVTDFVILDHPVELTRAGLKLASGAPSEQEAYNGAQALLEKLKERGITLELPDFAAQIDRQPDHVTARADGLRVIFDKSVQGTPGVPSQTVTQAFDLGSSTALVAAFDRERRIDVSINGDNVTVQPEPEAAPPPVVAPPSNGQNGSGGAQSKTPPTRLGGSGRVKVDSSDSPTADTAVPPVTGNPGSESEPPAEELLNDVPNPEPDTEEGAFPGEGVVDNLGLRNAQSVSRAFGAFLGFGLILPLARFVIRRFG